MRRAQFAAVASPCLWRCARSLPEFRHGLSASHRRGDECRLMQVGASKECLEGLQGSSLPPNEPCPGLAEHERTRRERPVPAGLSRQQARLARLNDLKPLSEQSARRGVAKFPQLHLPSWWNCCVPLNPLRHCAPQPTHPMPPSCRRSPACFGHCRPRPRQRPHKASVTTSGTERKAQTMRFPQRELAGACSKDPRNVLAFWHRAGAQQTCSFLHLRARLLGWPSPANQGRRENRHTPWQHRAYTHKQGFRFGSSSHQCPPQRHDRPPPKPRAAPAPGPAPPPADLSCSAPLPPDEPNPAASPPPAGPTARHVHWQQ